MVLAGSPVPVLFGVPDELARIAGNARTEEDLEPDVAVDDEVTLLEMEDDGLRERESVGDLVVAHHLDGIVHHLDGEDSLIHND